MCPYRNLVDLWTFGNWVRATTWVGTRASPSCPVTELCGLCVFFVPFFLTTQLLIGPQGTAIWHPRCGPGPGHTNGNITLYLNEENRGHHEDKDDRISSSAASETQVRRRRRRRPSRRRRRAPLRAPRVCVPVCRRFSVLLTARAPFLCFSPYCFVFSFP